MEDLLEEIRAQASGAGLTELYAIGNEAGEQLAQVRDRNLAFVVARQNSMTPVSDHQGALRTSRRRVWSKTGRAQDHTIVSLPPMTQGFLCSVFPFSPRRC